jgi:4-hydroxybenzoate polyprenyltransferase
MSEPTVQPQRKLKWYRKSLVVPTEHGAWTWLLVPYFVGLIVAGQLNVEVLLVLVGGLSAYFVRQPLTAWLRIRRGQGRKSDRPIAAGWAIGFSALAVLCLIGLLASGLTDLALLTLPIIGLFIAYLGAARQKRSSTRTTALPGLCGL